ncbi:MGDG synthase family glycosyltransferase [Lihuaxuella thermophila]|uniref:Processive 1,2-diacylglycerol beta-glucosyltransferase n=1 Tax=Lihuaxuella thermophila TaxID=1173111 RepID=A0A1H8E0R3_9BACL|nr:glycosyltransferase [Lihuaxuella thermophila]SEN13030.1 processive 1,2-diacylglycerol beta-glucosyltransferase [Lihuaxuella thermophila]
MDKVLILTEDVGGTGHYGAARSLKKGLEKIAPNLHVEIAFGLSFVSKQLELLTRTSYLSVLKYAPSLWEKAYAREESISQLFQTPLGKMLAIKLKHLIEQIQPRVVVCTHVLCISALAHLKEKTHLDFRLGVSITDFDVNGFWIHPKVDFYLVAHPALKDKIRKRHIIPEEKIFCTGIPIDPAFSVAGSSKYKLREDLGFDPSRFTALVMGGGMGLGPVEECISMFRQHMPEVQLIVITGKNQRLYDRLRLGYQQDRHVRLFGFIDGMVNMMRAADIVVSKAGGLTSSEALASGLPMLICRPIPGQEERNSRFLLEQQVAIRQDQPESIPRDLTPFIEDQAYLQKWSRHALSIGKPFSALHGAEVIVNHL